MIIQLSKNLKETPEISSIFKNDIIEIYTSAPCDIDWKECLYLKVFTKSKIGNFDNISRISMLSAEYVSSEFDNHTLSSKELHEFIKALNTNIEDDISIWQLAIKTNNVYAHLEDDNLIPLSLEIPDYSLLLTK